MNEITSSAEALLYHFANRYLRQLLPSEYLAELQNRFTAAEQQVNDNPEAFAWSQRVLWLSHWDGVLSSHVELENAASILSTALLKNQQVTIRYEGKDEPFQFNVYGLVKRDENILVLGSYWQSNDPCMLSVRKILAIDLTDNPAIQPKPDFDLQNFLQRQVNFPHSSEKIACLQIEFTEDLYSYVRDNALVADHIHIVTADNYHHHGHFLLEAQGIADGERLRQWIRGFGNKAQVLKPDDLRVVMEPARLDARTNLLAATEFKRCLKREVQRCLRNSQMTFALLILDLDHFKQVNDRNGHPFGDVVLLKVADCIREYDEAARYGGEEFCILLPNTNASGALTIAERIRQQIEQQSLKNQHGNIVPITASIGLAVFPDDLPSELKAEMTNSQNVVEPRDIIGSTIFYQADQALYKAKAQGRNRVCLAAVSA